MDWDDNEFEFPGWSTETNPHGKEFNKEARRRMVSGSETLLPYIYKYKKELGENILEIGPFFCPLVSFKNFPNKNICYWENDYHVLEWFKKNYKEGNNKIIYCNLNSINGSKLMKLKEEKPIYSSLTI